MTPPQKTLYWRLWSSAAARQHWTATAAENRCRRQAAISPAPELQALYDRIWDQATLLAQAEHRAVLPDHLRHAIHIIAGGPGSSADLSHTQLDRVFSILKLLANPTSVDSLQTYLHPEIKERRNLVTWCRQLAEEQYICHLVAHAIRPPGYEHPFWEDIPLPNLRALHRLLRQRRAKDNGSLRVSASPRDSHPLRG